MDKSACHSKIYLIQVLDQPPLVAPIALILETQLYALNQLASIFQTFIPTLPNLYASSVEFEPHFQNMRTQPQNHRTDIAPTYGGYKLDTITTTFPTNR